MKLGNHKDGWKTFNAAHLVEKGILEIGDGYRAEDVEMGERGLPFLRAANVKGFIEVEGVDLLSEASVVKAGEKTSRPFDVVLTTKGSVGRSAFVKPETPRFVYSPQLSYWRVKDKSVIEPRYLYYWIQGDEFGKQVHKVKGLTDMADYVSLTDQRRMDITLPPVTVQAEISAVLSAYDDLIGNNRRRIQILEEMAKAIYREWFVNFRFPGYEDVMMVDSEFGEIPEGWQVLTLDRVLSTIESGSRPRGGIDSGERAVPSIGAENVIGLGKYDYESDKYVSEEFYARMRRGHVRSGDVLLYKDGAQIGRKTVFRDGFPHPRCCINEHVLILRTNDKCTQNYLHFWLDLPEVTQRIVNLNSNAAQPGINQAGVLGLPVLIPPMNTVAAFDKIVDPMMGLLFNLAKSIRILQQVRDILLPGLVSGEIDVSVLGIDDSHSIEQTSKYRAQPTLEQWLDRDEEHGVE